MRSFLAAPWFRGLDWQTEIAALASAQGADVKPVTLPSGRMSLAWTRLGVLENFELVGAAQARRLVVDARGHPRRAAPAWWCFAPRRRPTAPAG